MFSGIGLPIFNPTSSQQHVSRNQALKNTDMAEITATRLAPRSMVITPEVHLSLRQHTATRPPEGPGPVFVQSFLITPEFFLELPFQFIGLLG